VNVPVDYAAQVQYFAKRSMAEAIRMMIGIGNGITAVISLTILLPWASSDGLASEAVVTLFAVLTMFWAVVWCCRPWPSRPMSLAFVISCDIGIAIVALHHPTWLTGLFGFNAFAAISVYLLFFDGPKGLALHVFCISMSTAIFAVQLGAGAQYHGAAFAAATLAAVSPVVATPLGIQFGIWTLRNDANDSVTDPLTGLLNRRGMHLNFGELLRDHRVRGGHLATMVIDIDRFKRVNDTFGHATGDDVLIRTAHRIKSAVRGTALVARVGGEEFIVLDVTEPDHTQHIAERVRCAIAAASDQAPVTASIGVTHAALDTFTAPHGDVTALLDTSIRTADQALLNAKRNGGNTAVHLPPIDVGD
jgi:diguanylate cyclase (GGDEF)-like protein